MVNSPCYHVSQDISQKYLINAMWIWLKYRSIPVTEQICVDVHILTGIYSVSNFTSTICLSIRMGKGKARENIRCLMFIVKWSKELDKTCTDSHTHRRTHITTHPYTNVRQHHEGIKNMRDSSTNKTQRTDTYTPGSTHNLVLSEIRCGHWGRSLIQ